MLEGLWGHQSEVLGRVLGEDFRAVCALAVRWSAGHALRNKAVCSGSGPCLPLPSENGHLYPSPRHCLLSVSPLDIKLYVVSFQHLPHCQAHTDQVSEIIEREALRTILWG